MDDLSVFRRFFVVSNLLRDILGAMSGGGGQISPDSPQVSPYASQPNPFTESEAPIKGNQTVGGQSPSIRGTRPAPPPRPAPRPRRAAPQLPNTARYGFPKPDESV